MISAFNFIITIKEHRFTKRYPLIIKCTPIHYNRFIESIIDIYRPNSMLTIGLKSAVKVQSVLQFGILC